MTRSTSQNTIDKLVAASTVDAVVKQTLDCMSNLPSSTREFKIRDLYTKDSWEKLPRRARIDIGTEVSKKYPSNLIDKLPNNKQNHKLYRRK